MFIYQYRDSTSARVETLSGFHSSTSRFLSHSLGAQDYSQTTRCKNLEITQVGLSLKRSHKTYRDPQLDRLLLCIVYDSSFDYEHVIKRIIFTPSGRRMGRLERLE